jgi:hypothetical protein
MAEDVHQFDLKWEDRASAPILSADAGAGAIAPA